MPDRPDRACNRPDRACDSQIGLVIGQIGLVIGQIGLVQQHKCCMGSTMSTKLWKSTAPCTLSPELWAAASIMPTDELICMHGDTPLVYTPIQTKGDIA